jgi:hypothetical protein
VVLVLVMVLSALQVKGYFLDTSASGGLGARGVGQPLLDLGHAGLARNHGLRVQIVTPTSHGIPLRLEYPRRCGSASSGR